MPKTAASAVAQRLDRNAQLVSGLERLPRPTVSLEAVGVVAFKILITGSESSPTTSKIMDACGLTNLNSGTAPIS
jgi:hypothetical protein